MGNRIWTDEQIAFVVQQVWAGQKFNNDIASDFISRFPGTTITPAQVKSIKERYRDDPRYAPWAPQAGQRSLQNTGQSHDRTPLLRPSQDPLQDRGKSAAQQAPQNSRQHLPRRPYRSIAPAPFQTPAPNQFRNPSPRFQNPDSIIGYPPYRNPNVEYQVPGLSLTSALVRAASTGNLHITAEEDYQLNGNRIGVPHPPVFQPPADEIPDGRYFGHMPEASNHSEQDNHGSYHGYNMPGDGHHAADTDGGQEGPDQPYNQDLGHTDRRLLDDSPELLAELSDHHDHWSRYPAHGPEQPEYQDQDRPDRRSIDDSPELLAELSDHRDQYRQDHIDIPGAHDYEEQDYGNEADHGYELQEADYNPRDVNNSYQRQRPFQDPRHQEYDAIESLGQYRQEDDRPVAEAAAAISTQTGAARNLAENPASMQS